MTTAERPTLLGSSLAVARLREGVMRLKNQDEAALQDHVFSTYKTLRYGLAVLGIALPGLLWAVGLVGYGIDLQPSMSHYYFAPYPDNPDETTFPVRAWFVGLLFAIGTGLLLYRGFTNWENASLNLAGGARRSLRWSQ
jgi:hypothetical protein